MTSQAKADPKDILEGIRQGIEDLERQTGKRTVEVRLSPRMAELLGNPDILFGLKVKVYDCNGERIR
ncbi:MAG: hypothetical protein KGR26_14010 [Cyanobacteria bacterium REEB65]|nr:hypothetical protein [Cyanobacteria bacterium REEB65]